MNDFFTFFAEIGKYIIFAFILAGLLALYLLGKKIYSFLSKEHSEKASKAVSIILCVVIGIVSVFSLFCSMTMKSSDLIYVIFYDDTITAGDTMHVIFKGKPDTLYNFEFDGGSCKSSIKKSNGAGYISYTYKTTKTASKGEESFYIFEYEDSDNITDYYYFTVK